MPLLAPVVAVLGSASKSFNISAAVFPVSPVDGASSATTAPVTARGACTGAAFWSLVDGIATLLPVVLDSQATSKSRIQIVITASAFFMSLFCYSRVFKFFGCEE